MIEEAGTVCLEEESVQEVLRQVLVEELFEVGHYNYLNSKIWHT